MSPTDIKPSPRLLRAAEAERADLHRQRARLAADREKALSELRQIEQAIADVDEQEMLLAQLVLGPVRDARATTPPAGVTSIDASDATGSAGESAQARHEALRGPAIRETAVRLLVRRGDIEALHYREWFELLRREGYEVAGKNALAVFLTQISRSPVVRKGTESGVYELDRRAPQRLRRRLERLQSDLRELTARTPGTTDLSEVRARRDRITAAISQTERALEESERVLEVDTDERRVSTASIAAAG